MVRVRCRLLACLVSAFAVSLLGCGTKSSTSEKPAPAAHDEHGHDHDHAHDHKHEGDADHPHTFAEAVEKVQQLRTAVRDNLAAKEKGKADDAVHEVGHVLEDLPKLAESASLAPEALSEVKKATDELLDLFGKIDEQIHADKEPNYDEVSAKIDAAVEQLQAKVAK